MDEKVSSFCLQLFFTSKPLGSHTPAQSA